MLRLLERNIQSVHTRLVLLAPPGAVPAFFRNVENDPGLHREFMHNMQALRGKVYLQEGAIEPHELSVSGRHRTIEDERSWHLLTLDERQQVTGCAWYLEHDAAVQLQHLRLKNTPLARMNAWRHKLQVVVEAEIAHARRIRLKYAEVGGWAVARKASATCEGLVLALASYCLGDICGGCLGVTTATFRNCSSAILRRLGGVPLNHDGTPLPSYYDPQYRCEMEILRFDSRKPSDKYADLIGLLREKMADVRVIAM